MEIFLALLPVATCVGKLVESGLKLSAAEDDMNAASMLLSIISDTAKSVRLRHEQLSEKLNPEQKERIRTTLSRTDHLLGLSKKALNRKFTTSVSGEVGMLALSDRLVWVFRDRGRLITYQTVLDMLHAVLLAISIELATLKTMPDDSEPQSPVDPIYSDPSKSAIVTGLAAYDGTSTMESGDLYSMESKVSIVEDLKRTYAERMRRQQLARNKFEATESELAETKIELSIPTDLKKRFADRTMRVSDIYQAEWTPRSNSIAGDLKMRFEMRAAKTAGVV